LKTGRVEQQSNKGTKKQWQVIRPKRKRGHRQGAKVAKEGAWRILSRFGAIWRIFTTFFFGGGVPKCAMVKLRNSKFHAPNLPNRKIYRFLPFLPCSRFLRATVLVKTGPPFFDPF